MSDTVVVFTDAKTETILAQRGSSGWLLNPTRASQAKYLVCCRKSHWSNMEDPAPNGAAFLVAHIKSIQAGEIKHSPTKKRGQQRYFIEISDFAAISKEKVWKEWRNPVRYEALDKLGINVRSLKFSSLPAAGAKSARSGQAAHTPPRSLTIAEAKKALAASFGVSPDDVEIHIRG